MSSLTDSFATSKITVWAIASTDDYGAPTFANPVVFDASLKTGGDTAKDEQGVEFQPQSTYWPSVAIGVISRGQYIAKGDQSAVPDPTTISSEIIRQVNEFDNSFFGWTEDVVLLTG
jgi:hypothetical protein